MSWTKQMTCWILSRILITINIYKTWRLKPCSVPLKQKSTRSSKLMQWIRSSTRSTTRSKLRLDNRMNKPRKSRQRHNSLSSNLSYSTSMMKSSAKGRSNLNNQSKATRKSLRRSTKRRKTDQTGINLRWPTRRKLHLKTSSSSISLIRSCKIINKSAVFTPTSR